MSRPLAFLSLAAALGVLGSAFASSLAACTGNGSATQDVTALDASEDAGTVDGAPDDAAPSLSTCALTRAYVTGCNAGMPADAGDPLTCGAAKFDAWCALNDKAINSASFQRAEAMCLTQANCDPAARHDCEYRSYATATPTAAQKAVVLAYCQTCEPADPAACVRRETTYVPAAGPGSTDDVFTAAWELGDALDDAIRTGCTGAAADAGTNPAPSACLKQFADCAGGIYVDQLPDCP